MAFARRNRVEIAVVDAENAEYATALLSLDSKESVVSKELQLPSLSSVSANDKISPEDPFRDGRRRPDEDGPNLDAVRAVVLGLTDRARVVSLALANRLEKLSRRRLEHETLGLSCCCCCVSPSSSLSESESSSSNMHLRLMEEALIVEMADVDFDLLEVR